MFTWTSLALFKSIEEYSIKQGNILWRQLTKFRKNELPNVLTLKRIGSSLSCLIVLVEKPLLPVALRGLTVKI